MPSLPAPLTRAEGLSIFRSALAADDYASLTATPDGLAAVTGIVELFVDLSARLDRSATGRHMLARASDVSAPAGLARAAIATLSVTRSRVGFPLPLPVGVPVVSPDGHRYRTTTATAFAAADGSAKTVTAVAEVPAYVSTALAGTLTAFVPVANGCSGDLASVVVSGGVTYLDRHAGDRFFPALAGMMVEFLDGVNAGRVAQLVSLVDDDRAVLDATDLLPEANSATWVVQEWADLGLAVTNQADASQGRDDDLGALARDVGLQPSAGQTEDQLHEAVRAQVETVAPIAIVRLVNRILGAYGPAMLYETGSAPSDSDAALGIAPWPGFVVGLTPAGLDELAAVATSADPPFAPVEGCSGVGRIGGYFAIRWDGAGLGDPGGYAERSPAVGEDDAPLGPPMSFAAGLSPAGGWASDDDAIRATIWAAVARARAAGVGWRFFPRYSPM